MVGIGQYALRCIPHLLSLYAVRKLHFSGSLNPLQTTLPRLPCIWVGLASRRPEGDWQAGGRGEGRARTFLPLSTSGVSSSGCFVSSVLSNPLGSLHHGSAPGGWPQPLDFGNYFFPLLLRPLGRWQLTTLEYVHLLPFVLKV